MVANSCTNREPIRKGEVKGRNPEEYVAKDPLALLRYKTVEEPMYLVRDYRSVLTSTTHSQFKGPVISVKDLEKIGKRIPEGADLWWYEDLCADPDGFQGELADSYGLVFDKRFSDFPWDIEYRKRFNPLDSYWSRSLGELRPIGPPRFADLEVDGDFGRFIYRKRN